MLYENLIKFCLSFLKNEIKENILFLLQRYYCHLIEGFHSQTPELRLSDLGRSTVLTLRLCLSQSLIRLTKSVIVIDLNIRFLYFGGVS